jgi:hypothetical protein
MEPRATLVTISHGDGVLLLPGIQGELVKQNGNRPEIEIYGNQTVKGLMTGMPPDEGEIWPI